MLLKSNWEAIFTGIIIVIGVALVMPLYYQSYYQKYYQDNLQSSESEPDSNPKIMFAFSINNNKGMPYWCNKLSSIVKSYDLKGSVFISGNVAEKFPDCVRLFSSGADNIDVGSQTYSYTNLTSISDYTKQLDEVQNGKKIVDNTGKINSTLFKAPYGSTDQNIYSLLSRSGINADFSYTDHYNIYENGQFIRYDLISYNTSTKPEEVLDAISSNKQNVVIIDFNNSVSIEDIDSFISKIKEIDENNNIQYISASELAGMNLNT